MPDSTFRQGAQKGTVYKGPVPQTKGTIYNGPSPGTQGTVYNGPSIQTPGGTVYNGPAPGGTSGETYGRSQQTAARAGAVPTSDIGKKIAKIFYAIGGFSLVNTLLLFVGFNRVIAIGLGITRVDIAIRDGGPLGSALLLNVLAAGFFVLLGVFAQYGSRLAILIGMLAYAADTVFLIKDGVGSHIFSIVFHGFFLLALVGGYRKLPD